MHVNIKQQVDRKVISTYFQTQRRLRYVSSINIIAFIMFKLCWGSNWVVQCNIKLMSIKRTFTLTKWPRDKFVISSYRFKTNFNCKTSFTTKRGYIEKGFKFKDCTEPIPMTCILLIISILEYVRTIRFIICFRVDHLRRLLLYSTSFIFSRWLFFRI